MVHHYASLSLRVFLFNWVLRRSNSQMGTIFVHRHWSSCVWDRCQLRVDWGRNIYSQDSSPFRQRTSQRGILRNFQYEVCDRFTIKTASAGSLVLFLLNCIFTLVGYYLPTFLLTWIICFSWGIAMTSLSACLMVICSRLYEGHPESFAVVKQLHSFAFVIFEVLTIITNSKVKIPWIMGGLLVFWLAGCYGVWKLPKEKYTEIL